MKTRCIIAREDAVSIRLLTAAHGCARLCDTLGGRGAELVQPQEDLDTTIAKNIEYLLE